MSTPGRPKGEYRSAQREGSPMSTARGALHLVPNTLDFGMAGAPPDLQEALPLGVIRIASRLEHWIAENAKTARAFLKRVDSVVPLLRPLQAISIVELRKPPKGGIGKAPAFDAASLLGPALQGHDIGLISEAGLPAVADPGAAVVAAAHALDVRVVPLPGASSLMLALAASGLNGQSFAFVGYLPIDPAARAARIKELEGISRRHAQTQLAIETPYRNGALLAALLDSLQGPTRLSVSCALTLPGGFVCTDRVTAWRTRATTLPADLPAVFSFLAA